MSLRFLYFTTTSAFFKKGLPFLAQPAYIFTFYLNIFSNPPKTLLYFMSLFLAFLKLFLVIVFPKKPSNPRKTPRISVLFCVFYFFDFCIVTPDRLWYNNNVMHPWANHAICNRSLPAAKEAAPYAKTLKTKEAPPPAGAADSSSGDSLRRAVSLLEQHLPAVQTV